MLNCVISSKLRKPSLQLLCTGLYSWVKLQLVLGFKYFAKFSFKHFAKKQVLVSEDFTINSESHKLLILDPICCNLFANVTRVRFLGT